MNNELENLLKGLAAFVASTALKSVTVEAINQLSQSRYKILPKFQDIYESTQKLIDTTDISRVTLLAVHKPSFVKKIKGEETWEADALMMLNEDYTDNIRQYQKVEIDEKYIEMVKYIEKHVFYEMMQEEIKAGEGVLPKIYQTIGIETARIKFVMKKRGVYFIVSYSKRVNEKWDDPTRELIRRNTAEFKEFLNFLL